MIKELFAAELDASKKGSIANVCQHSVPKTDKIITKFTEGDYTYTIAKCKPKIEIMRDPFYIVANGVKLQSIHDDQLKLATQIIVIIEHKNGSKSVRRLMRRNGKYVYSDLRNGGLGSGLSRSEFLSSLPQPSVAKRIVSKMEESLPIVKDNPQKQIEALAKQLLETMAKQFAFADSAPVASK